MDENQLIKHTCMSRHLTCSMRTVRSCCWLSWKFLENVLWASGPAVSAAGNRVGALTHHGAAAGSDRPATEAGSCAYCRGPRLSTRSGQKGECLIYKPSPAQLILLFPLLILLPPLLLRSSYSSSVSFYPQPCPIPFFSFLLSASSSFHVFLVFLSMAYFLLPAFASAQSQAATFNLHFGSSCGKGSHTSLFGGLELMIHNTLGCNVVPAHSSEYRLRLFFF